jgi:hypothetical protein
MSSPRAFADGLTPEMRIEVQATELVATCQELGLLAESSEWFTWACAERLGDRELDTLTIGELRELIRIEREIANEGKPSA